MTKYSDIEIQTAENLLKRGFKWIARNQSGRLSAHACKPSKVNTYWWSVGYSDCTCNYVPIFQSVRFVNKEPTSLESIVHPQILDDTEKRYLKGVIRPFRDRVEFISKVVMDYQGGCTDCYNCYICIRFTDSSKDMSFPVFCETDMYKGMKLYEKYTLEELGL